MLNASPKMAITLTDPILIGSLHYMTEINLLKYLLFTNIVRAHKTLVLFHSLIFCDNGGVCLTKGNRGQYGIHLLQLISTIIE